MNRYILGSIAVFATIFFYEFVFHGMLLDGLYSTILQHMRPEEEFMGYFPWIVIGELMMAFFFSYIFTRGYENRGLMEGVRFGLLIGLGFGSATSLIQYAVHPFP